MANTATLVTSTPYRVVYLLSGDGTVAGPTIANATLLADMVAGPLEDIFNATYANQAAMRTACLTSAPCRVLVQLRTAVNDVTAQQNQIAVDVDVDAVTATKPEVNVTMSDTTGQEAYLTIEFLHSIIK
jgi:hypothetical protein